MSPIGSPPSGGSPGGPASGGLPERMKANKSVAGKGCATCNVIIKLGEEIWNCPGCGVPQHEACRNEIGGCSLDGCSYAPKEDAAAAGGAPGETKACPYCGEQVLKSAKKCKHCKEILSESLRASRDRRNAPKNPNAGRDALVYGIIGLLVCQIILGPMAIIRAREAHKNGLQTGMATAGMVLGILDLLLFFVVVIAQLGKV